MIRTFLLFAFLGTTLGAPIYGQDGGYVGYASYDPSRGRRASSGESSSSAVQGQDGSPELRSSRRQHKGGNRRTPSVAPPLSKTAHNSVTEDEQFDFLRLNGQDDPLSKTSGVNPELLTDNYIVPHYGTLFGHKDGYKISDVSPKAKQNVYSNDYAPQDLQPYEYGYKVVDEHGNVQSKKESSNGHKVQGTYGYVNEHGLFRQVDYVADAEGFRARVKTNEPGTENQNPADVLIESEHDSPKH